MYTEAKSALESIVQWLQSQDEKLWDDQAEVLRETIRELESSSRPKQRRDKTGSRSAEMPTGPLGAREIQAALPPLREMLAAMQRHDRNAALESATAALAALP
jgi:hypothetical protein